MAAKEIINIKFMDVEPVVNRWLLDYYHSLALDLFQTERYKDFLEIRNVLDSVMVRPLEVTETTMIKIQVLQLLSRVIDGESLDVLFESEHTSPLESALIVLERINQESNIPQQDFENAHTLLKEMMVSVLIKNDEFGKAEEVLKKYFPKPMVGKKAIFMGLIRQRSKTHEVIEQMDFRRFKEEMFAFCQKVFPVNVPFLYKAARACIDQRLEEPGCKSACEEPDEPGTSSNPQINTNGKFLPRKCMTISTRSKLEAAYTDLAAGSDEITFAQLSKEVKTEEQAQKELSLNSSPSPNKATIRDSQQDCSFQRSGSPLEASPADQPPQMDADPQTQAGSLSKTTSVPRRRRLYTVARLVVEPDSQVSSQYSAASQELETEVRSEEPPQATALPNKMDLQNPVTDIEIAIPKRNQPRQASKIYSSDSSSLSELEEDPPGEVANRETCMEKLHNQSNSSLSRKSKQLSDSEEPHESLAEASCKEPVQNLCKQLASDSLSRVPQNADEFCITNSSLDSSPSRFHVHPVPQTSSTPHKESAQDTSPSHSKWKRLLKCAKESKDTWNDESHLTSKRSLDGSPISKSGQKKRTWTEQETQNLKEGVKRFGQGNWSKILAYYTFNKRTNVHLKDRWRTMKKLKMV